ncbi:MAG: DNA repair protein RadA [Deltaproteobacteria bacterium]|nr:DNA repair protein RadA [Deltaproteobacteria bacterium]|tara:strand:- start:2315 stop:3688 length:1374 start_codon:yes stop_codon:yes gene_type:complete
MAKVKTMYQCTDCGNREPKWFGRCSRCGAWNTAEEFSQTRGKVQAEKAAARGGLSDKTKPIPITAIDEEDMQREQFGIHELDRVLGGGLVEGSLILLGGDPGIGKSTIALQSAMEYVQQGRKVLYVSGEESLRQTKMRAKRIGAINDDLLLLAEVDIERIKEEATKCKPDFLVVDSIQSVFCPDISSTPGSVSQIRESAARLMHLAKRESISTLLIGHVTKDGMIAGPRVLEHLVDTVLYFEGERGHPYRILRAVKNRFGSTNEIGVFEMKENGLVEVGNPSSLFLDQRPVGAAGSVVSVCLEGSRPLLVEVQALVGSPAYGNPRRTCTGVDPNRVALLVAVLEKSGGMQITASDIFVNVAGGFRLDEPAADLPIMLALASSFRGKALPQKMAIFGEVGLAGEIRGVSQAELRMQEAKKLGFTQIMIPENNRARLKKSKKATLLGVSNVDEALSTLF